jgi:hypothetical protein
MRLSTFRGLHRDTEQPPSPICRATERLAQMQSQVWEPDTKLASRTRTSKEVSHLQKGPSSFTTAEAELWVIYYLLQFTINHSFVFEMDFCFLIILHFDASLSNTVLYLSSRKRNIFFTVTHT